MVLTLRIRHLKSFDGGSDKRIWLGRKILLFALPPLWEDVSSTCLFLSSTLMKLVSSSTVSRIRSSKAALDRYRTIKDWIEREKEECPAPPFRIFWHIDFFSTFSLQTYFSNKSFNHFINNLNFKIANILLDDMNRMLNMFYNFLDLLSFKIHQFKQKICKNLWTAKIRQLSELKANIVNR